MRETGTQNTPEPVLLDFVNSLQQFIATHIQQISYRTYRIVILSDSRKVEKLKRENTSSFAGLFSHGIFDPYLHFLNGKNTQAIDSKLSLSDCLVL